MNQQTLSDIPGADTGGIKVLYLIYDFLYKRFLNNDILLEGKVINNGYRISSQITIIINASNNLFSNLFLINRKIQQAKLLHKHFVQGGHSRME